MIFMIQKFKIEYDWTTAQQPMVFPTNKKKKLSFRDRTRYFWIVWFKFYWTQVLFSYINETEAYSL